MFVPSVVSEPPFFISFGAFAIADQVLAATL